SAFEARRTERRFCARLTAGCGVVLCGSGGGNSQPRAGNRRAFATASARPENRLERCLASALRRGGRIAGCVRRRGLSLRRDYGSGRRPKCSLALRQGRPAWGTFTDCVSTIPSDAPLTL